MWFLWMCTSFIMHNALLRSGSYAFDIKENLFKYIYSNISSSKYKKNHIHKTYIWKEYRNMSQSC